MDAVIHDPYEWLRDYEAQLAGIQSKAENLQENLAAATATASSRDGAVKVTVGPNGGVQDLQLGPRACDLGPAKLTATILETLRKAQREASAKVVEACQPLGAGSETLQMIMDALPDEESSDSDEKLDTRYVPEEIESEPEAQRKPRHRRAPGPRKPGTQDVDADLDARPW